MNAPLPSGRIVVLRPPTILYKLKLLPQGHVWLVHKAIYGLREAPSLWSEERTDALTNLTFASEGESYAVILSQVHKSLCLIVKQQSLQDHLPSTDSFGLTSRVLPHQVVALSGIYVDDFLTASPPLVVRSFLAALRKMWRTSDPQFLSLDADLPFLGVSIRTSFCTSIFTLKIFCAITLRTSRLGKGTLLESQLTFKKILLCPLILRTLSIRDGSRLARKCLEDYFGSLLALGQILPCRFFCSPGPHKGFGAAQGQTQTPFAIPEHYSNFGITLPIP